MGLSSKLKNITGQVKGRVTSSLMKFKTRALQIPVIKQIAGVKVVRFIGKGIIKTGKFAGKLAFGGKVRTAITAGTLALSAIKKLRGRSKQQKVERILERAERRPSGQLTQQEIEQVGGQLDVPQEAGFSAEGGGTSLADRFKNLSLAKKLGIGALAIGAIAGGIALLRRKKKKKKKAGRRRRRTGGRRRRRTGGRGRRVSFTTRDGRRVSFTPRNGGRRRRRSRISDTEARRIVSLVRRSAR